MDLGSAGGGKNSKAGEVDVAVPTEEKDINALYNAELKRLAEPAPVEEKKKSAAQKQEDYYKVSLMGPKLTIAVNALLADIPNQYFADLGHIERWTCGWYSVSSACRTCRGDINSSRALAAPEMLQSR